MAGFGTGVDFLLHENDATYMEGGYHAASEDDLNEVGIFTLDACYRFRASRQSQVSHEGCE